MDDWLENAHVVLTKLEQMANIVTKQRLHDDANLARQELDFIPRTKVLVDSVTYDWSTGRPNPIKYREPGYVIKNRGTMCDVLLSDGRVHCISKTRIDPWDGGEIGFSDDDDDGDDTA